VLVSNLLNDGVYLIRNCVLDFDKLCLLFVD